MSVLANNVILIQQQYYFYITTAFTVLVATGYITVVYFIAKWTNNLLFYSALNFNVIGSVPYMLWNFRRLNCSRCILLVGVMTSYLTALIGTIMNASVPVYRTVGSISTLQATFVPSLGPISYLSGTQLATISNYTNTPTYDIVAQLFANSSLLPNKSPCVTSSCFTFSTDLTCSALSNVLTNSPGTIASSYEIETSIISPTLWNVLLSNETLSIDITTSSMGSQVSAIYSSNATNTATLALLNVAIKGKDYPVWFPIISSAAQGASYLWSMGTKGKRGAADNLAYDSLSTRLTDVIEIQFNTELPSSSGVLLGCFRFLGLDGLDIKCLHNLRKYKGFELYDVIVFGEDDTFDGYNANFVDLQTGQSAGKAMGFIPGLDPWIDQGDTPLSYRIDPKSKHLLIQNASTPNSDALSINNPEDAENAKVLYTVSKHKTYTVMLQTSVITSYKVEAVQTSDDSTMVISPFSPMESNCQNNAKGYSVFSDPPGNLSVILSWPFIILLSTISLLSLVLFMYNDYSFIILTEVGKKVGEDEDALHPKNYYAQSTVGEEVTAHGKKLHTIFVLDKEKVTSDPPLPQDNAVQTRSVKIAEF